MNLTDIGPTHSDLEYLVETFTDVPWSCDDDDDDGGGVDDDDDDDDDGGGGGDDDDGGGDDILTLAPLPEI